MWPPFASITRSIEATKILCKRQSLACSLGQTKPGSIFSKFDAMIDAKHCAWGCKHVCWSFQTLRPDHSVGWRQDLWWKFSHQEIWEFDSSDSTGYSTFGCPIQTLLDQQWISGTSQTFSPYLFYLSRHSGDWNFRLIFRSGLFSKAFLIVSWLLTRDFLGREISLRLVTNWIFQFF